MVKKYPWDDSIATGDAVIDLQHKQFFAVLYDFAEALEQGKGADELRKLLVFLKYYGEWHFGKEEASVACCNCPLAGQNIDAHKHYMVTIDALLTQIRESGTSEELAMSSYEKLTDWLVNHIMKIDKINADHISSYKNQQAAEAGKQL
jgi:hemerythrin